MLRTALQLISERGYAAASLRELARRLGVQQPSLYHYFRSKDELVEQIISHLGASMLHRLAPSALPARATGLPAFMVDFIVGLYRDETYPQFVRFIFLTALEQPQHRAAIRRLYTELSEQTLRLFLRPYVERGEIELDDAVHLLQLIVRGLGLAYIEERVLYDQRDAETLLAPMVEYVRRAGDLLIAAAAQQARRTAKSATAAGSRPAVQPAKRSGSDRPRAKRAR